MQVINYNGQGDWAEDAILRRYARYCQELKISNPVDLTPQTYVQADKTWVYPMMAKVIAAIEAGDLACRRLGIEFIEQDQKFPFGKILKSNTARALRRANLSSEEIERIRIRLVSMLIAGNVPHEYKEYAKLLKKVGLDRHGADLEQKIDRANPYAMKYFQYLTKI